MKKYNVDVAIIGTGPAGEGAAMMAAKNHLSTVVIERYVDVGGGCTHWGTIPSKALRYAVKQINEVRHNPLLQSLRRQIRVTYPELLETAGGVVGRQVASRHRAYERNDVPIIEGAARFKDAHTLMIEHERHTVAQIKAKTIVIATGSRP